MIEELHISGEPPTAWNSIGLRKGELCYMPLRPSGTQREGHSFLLLLGGLSRHNPAGTQPG
ncbi:hypothetical protein [Cecembia lonarensis]|uniref:hypothetical protein n=1 Tax=Cecembia lonarensis TaxID=645110 RepID=UPI00058D0552|nr:hypothetical protein [Cecembia lonarensis]